MVSPSEYWNNFLNRARNRESGYNEITYDNFWKNIPDDFWTNVPPNFWENIPPNFWSTVPHGLVNDTIGLRNQAAKREEKKKLGFERKSEAVKDLSIEKPVGPFICKDDADVIGATPGTSIQLDAVGPQDHFLDNDRSHFNPKVVQHTPFVTYQKEYKLLAPFIGKETKFGLNPKTMGHVLTNAWVKCTLPTLPVPPTGIHTTRDCGPHLVSGDYDCEIETLPGYVISNVYIHNDLGNNYGESNTIVGWDQDTYTSNIIYINIDTAGGESNVTWNTGLGGANNYILSTQTDATTNIYSGDVYSSINQATGGVTTNVYIRTSYTLLDPKYADQVGRALLKKVKLRVGNYTLQTLIDDWYIIRDQVFTTKEQKEGLKYLINGGQDYGQLPASPVGGGPIPLFIPLDLFFCHRHNYTVKSGQRRPYLPLCALTRQDIELSIQFNDLDYFTYMESAFRAAGLHFRTEYPFWDLTDVSLVLEMADLEPMERQFYAQGKYDIVAPTIYRQPKVYFNVGDNTAVNLIPNGAIKSTFWFMRSVLFEDDQDDTYYNQRFNFSSKITTDVDTQDEFSLLTKATLYLEGYQQQNFGISHLYYKYIQPMTTNITPPDTNVYTLAYALETLNSQPSGFLDLSVTGSGKAVLKLDTEFKAGSSSALEGNKFVINAIHFGEMVLRIDDGQLTPLFSLT